MGRRRTSGKLLERLVDEGYVSSAGKPESHPADYHQTLPQRQRTRPSSPPRPDSVPDEED